MQLLKSEYPFMELPNPSSTVVDNNAHLANSNGVVIPPLNSHHLNALTTLNGLSSLEHHNINGQPNKNDQ